MHPGLEKLYLPVYWSSHTKAVAALGVSDLVVVRSTTYFLIPEVRNRKGRLTEVVAYYVPGSRFWDTRELFNRASPYPGWASTLDGHQRVRSTKCFVLCINVVKVDSYLVRCFNATTAGVQQSKVHTFNRIYSTPCVLSAYHIDISGAGT